MHQTSTSTKTYDDSTRGPRQGKMDSRDLEPSSSPLHSDHAPSTSSPLIQSAPTPLPRAAPGTYAETSSSSSAAPLRTLFPIAGPPPLSIRSHHCIPPVRVSSRNSHHSRQWSCDSDLTLVSSPTTPPPPYSDNHIALDRRLMSSHHREDQGYYGNPVSQSVHPAHGYRRHDSRAHGPPLISLVTNDWQNKPDNRDESFDSNDSYGHFMSEKEGFQVPRLPDCIPRLKIPRRVQRYLLAYFLFVVGCWFGWLYWLQPAWQEEKILDDSLATATKKGQIFGQNVRPTFSDMIHLENIDPSLIPGTSGAEDRRLIFIGDVHGCKDEFQQLLDKISFTKDRDHVILTGDLIAKGPDSRGAVDLAMSIGASCVRGNWEDRTLLAYNSLTAKVHPLPGPQEDPHTQEDFLDEESFSHGDYKDRALAKLLSKEHVKWLQKCPVILQVGALPGFNGGSEVTVVHAGLVPGVALERQDPFFVMNMRSMDLNTQVPSEDRKGKDWDKIWNHHQSHTHPASQRSTVIYGHDSKRGLNIKKYTKGLDSGCLKGKQLTALIIDGRGRQKIVSVDCKRYKD